MPCLESPQFEMNGDVSCTPEWLNAQLNQGRELLLLDCRIHGDFLASHVRGAICVSIPNLLLRRLKKGNLSVSSAIQCNEMKQKFDKMWKNHNIVLYDGCTTDLNANPSSVISLLQEKLRQDECQVCYLQGGFSVFREKYSEHLAAMNDNDDTSKVTLGLRSLSISDSDQDNSDPNISDSDSPNQDCLPLEVVPFLYLGNAKNAADLESLHMCGIRYILNVTPNLPNKFEDHNEITYKQIPINDHWSQNLSMYFPEAIAFINKARREKAGVLVHCLAGISRSVTVTVAYLMQEFNMTLNDAYDFLKKRKPNISPNFNFMGQLLDFERTLTSPKTCSCRKGLHCLHNDTKTYFMTPTKTSPNYELEVAPACT